MRTILLPLMTLLCCGILAAPAAAEDNAELAKKAKALLQEHCYRCHGKGGRDEGGFNYVLDRDRLIQGNIILPGKPDDSKLYRKVASGSMPKKKDKTEKLPPFPAEGKAVLEQWIAAGAPDFNPPRPKREFISNRDVLQFIADDLEKKVPERKREFARYFTITHLYNAGLSDDELLSYRAGLSKLLNSLSWNRIITKPVPIDPAQTIFRIDLRDFDWDAPVWDAILAANPYGVKYNVPAADTCFKYTHTSLPFVRADWFVFAASRPPLYHDVLRLPKTDRELEKKLDIEVAKNIREEKVARAGFNGSGVSQNNRLLEWHLSSYGAYWKSYDFANNEGREDLFKHPLGPGDDDSFFKHAGGEIIFNLPNKMQAYMLVNNKGERIDKGPTAIVSDTKQPDRAVLNGISCMSCHAEGMIFKDDQIRPRVEANPNAFEKKDYDLILALYPPKDDFRKKLDAAAKDFRAAVEATGAPFSETEPVYTLAKKFESEIDIKLAAAEIGVTVEDFKKALDDSRILAREVGELKANITVKRDKFVAAFGLIVREMKLGEFVPPSNRQQRGGEEIEVEIAKGVKMTFCWVPEGEAQLGSPKAERLEVMKNGDFKEEPEFLKLEAEEVRPKFKTKGFWLAKYPVTQEQWKALMGNNPSYFQPTEDEIKKAGITDTSRFPVENVCWDDPKDKEHSVQEFLRKLNAAVQAPAAMGKGKFVLPHEDEWEYACRGGKGNKQPFYFGNRLNGDLANCDGTVPYGTTTKGDYKQRTTQVGEYVGKAPHPWGLCDMSGNVYQWCENKYKEDGESRVLRGGSWSRHAWFCRAADRYNLAPGIRLNLIGCRVCFRLD